MPTKNTFRRACFKAGTSFALSGVSLSSRPSYQEKRKQEDFGQHVSLDNVFLVSACVSSLSVDTDTVV